MNAIARPQLPVTKYTESQLGATMTAQGMMPGGLDLTTPSLRLPPGTLTDALNFECAMSGGYARCGGYERRAGRAAPSAATFQLIQVVSFTNVPAVGLTVTQATSGATGTIIAVVTTPTPYLAVTQVTGTFDLTHALTVPGPVAVGTVTTLTVFLDPLTRALYKAAAAAVYRALIAAVPGAGSILGVLAMNLQGADNLYAFRANVGATAVAIYKASGSGWTLVPFYKIVSFTAATGSIPADGATLTQGGVTATVKRVMWQGGTGTGGSWAGSDFGQFVITTPSGGNFAGGAAGTTGGATMTLSGVQTAIMLAPGGRFEFVKTNFSGDIATRRAYGCDGVNPAFEFDGDVLAPIKSGLSPDAPSHLTAHKNYLILSSGSSMLGSGPGTPFKWTTTDGAWEIATGDVVNAMITLPGSQTSPTLAVFLHGNSGFLYGSDPSTFNFVTFNSNVGALPYTAQNFFDTFFLDALGVVTLKTTLNWGNFLPTTLTKNILPFIAQERSKITASTVNREKSQYRLFFNDGYALYATVVNQQYMGAIPQLLPNPALVVDETTLTDGSEATYFGSSNGFVYQMEKGTSFDGAAINAYFVTAWDPIRSPRVTKTFKAASMEVQGTGYAKISYSYQIGYGNTQIEQPTPTPLTLNLIQTARWDTFIWDEFVWDGVGLLPNDVSATGTAENIQCIVSSSGNYIEAYTVNSIIHHYIPRRGIRV